MPKGRNILIADALFRVGQENPPWPTDDSEKPLQRTLQTISPTEIKPEQESAVSSRVVPDKLRAKNELAFESMGPCTTEAHADNRSLWKQVNMENISKAY